jgi:hypothetical protein
VLVFRAAGSARGRGEPTRVIQVEPDPRDRRRAGRPPHAPGGVSTTPTLGGRLGRGRSRSVPRAAPGLLTCTERLASESCWGSHEIAPSNMPPPTSGQFFAALRAFTAAMTVSLRTL